MAWRYSKHYTREEAIVLLPQIIDWLDQLARHRGRVLQVEEQLHALLSKGGQDVGGPLVNESLHLRDRLKALLSEFASREIEIKDLDRGLIDFPALVDGQEVFLCWEKGEETIGFWHGLDAGYSGREPLDE